MQCNICNKTWCHIYHRIQYVFINPNHYAVFSLHKTDQNTESHKPRTKGNHATSSEPHTVSCLCTLCWRNSLQYTICPNYSVTICNYIEHNFTYNRNIWQMTKPLQKKYIIHTHTLKQNSHYDLQNVFNNPPNLVKF
jgi:hypothetical protein